MSTDLINKVLRVGEGRAMKSMQGQVERIGRLEEEIEKLSDAELRAKTDEFRARLEGDEPETLDDILNEAFAVVREVGRRKLGQRLFDVQLIGSMTLHSGKIAEMKTGEGKTLAAVPAVYLNALAGRGVHLVTVNDYLARRDAEWMGPIYDALGISVGVIGSMMPEPERRDVVRRRRHLRHQRRVRLRLPARQHGRAAGRLRPARPLLLHRGRGRLDPHRRGAHAAHHLGRPRGRDRHVLPVRAHRPHAQGRRRLRG